MVFLRNRKEASGPINKRRKAGEKIRQAIEPGEEFVYNPKCKGNSRGFLEKK